MKQKRNALLSAIPFPWLMMLMVDGMVVAHARELTFEDRVKAQTAIEQVYWAHRIWPKENAQPKPPLEQVMPETEIRAKVMDYLRKSAALETIWHRTITPEQLQAEMERMARHTRQPRILQDLFAALGDDPYLTAECLARPLLADRLIRTWYTADGRTEEANADQPTSADRPMIRSFDAWWERVRADSPGATLLAESSPAPTYPYTKPYLEATIACDDDTWTPTVYGAPDTRYSHTSVWTGSEMIVWGGRGKQGNYLNTGGRYSPATDTWEPTRAIGVVPQARAYHAAVWTGSRMVVWGGHSSGTPLNTGGRYDPSTDTWTATSTGLNVPPGRAYPAGVWTGTEMIVWGGWIPTFPGSYPQTGGRYNPVSDAWTPTGTGVNLPGGRREFTAVWTGSEMIVWGGYDGSFLDSGGRYNPSLDTWNSTSLAANRPTARSTHTAVWTGSEMIVWGGGGNSGAVDTGGRFSPSLNTWTPVGTGANHPAARQRHTAIWTGSRMIVWGGSGATYLNTGGQYDPSTDVWEPTSVSGGVPAGRYDHTAVWTTTEMIVWGGFGGGGSLNTGGRLTPGAGTWVPTKVGENPSERFSHSGVWTGSEMIVWGGSDGSFMNTGGRYDAATDSWSPTNTGANLPQPRANHTMVWTGTEMIVWGGGFPGLSTGGRYNPATDSWSATSTGSGVPSIRNDHTAVWTGREMIVWGGDVDSVPLMTGGSYDPSTDTWTATSTGTNVPSARTQHAAVWTGSEMVVWGGQGQGYVNTGGRYNPSTNSWSPTSTGMNVPSPRVNRTASWTGREMIVWGGFNGAFLSTGGRYNPLTDSWSPTGTGMNLPAGRRDHTVVWTGNEMIVWGGFNSSSYLNTGGRYDPAADAWTPTTSAGIAVPAPRQYHSAVWTGDEMIVWAGFPLTAQGSRYCAVPACAVGTWYRDTDGDGYGNTFDPVLSCSQPPGYVASGGDCNDANTNQAPGLPETCDGLDNDCDGTVDNAAPPAGTPSVQISKPSPGTARVSWGAVPSATGYDLIRGGLLALNSSLGDFSTATGNCLDNDLSATSADDGLPPASGDGFWYLVRAVNCGGGGTYDSDGTGQIGNRDAEIEASPNACP